MLLLGGDIGGTKTLLQAAEFGRGHLRVLAEHRYASPDYADLRSMVREFLTDQVRTTDLPDSACFAVAGPVRNREARLTYLPWVLQADRLSSELNVPRVRLINDFQGIGYGLDMLGAEDLEVIQQGEPQTRGTRALLGAGTGLGEGLLTWAQQHYIVHPSEGGHADFAPRTALEIELLQYGLSRGLRLSYDALLSGKGLILIYEFLLARDQATPAAAIAAALGSAAAAAVISEHALSNSDVVAARALRLFIEIYGAQAGNLALTAYATGGVYIAGGIAPKIIQQLNSAVFLDAFRAKAPMEELMLSFPVKVVMNPKVGLLGAMQIALRAATELAGGGHD